MVLASAIQGLLRDDEGLLDRGLTLMGGCVVPMQPVVVARFGEMNRCDQFAEPKGEVVISKTAGLGCSQRTGDKRSIELRGGDT
jgi:hypothetical protein